MNTAKVQTATTKRIEKVAIKRMIDDSPDTSWLGDYDTRAKSEYAIDRNHSTDCPINTGVTPLDSKTRGLADIAKSRCECADSGCPTACDGKCMLAASYLLFRTDMEDASGTMFCSGCGDDAFESGLYIMANDDELTEPQCSDDGCSPVDSRSCEYFNPCHENYKGLPDAEIRQYCAQDYERMESLNRGDLCFIGIRAEAEVIIGGICQEITSGGLWGIESDSDASYLAETEAEQLAELRGQLEAIGFSKRAVSAAFRNVQRTEE